MNILVFDIETVPDTNGGAKLLELNGLDKKDIIKAMEHTQFQKNGTMFQPLHLHKIVAISVLYKNNEKISLLSLGRLIRQKMIFSSYFFLLSINTNLSSLVGMVKDLIRQLFIIVHLYMEYLLLSIGIEVKMIEILNGIII